MEVISYTHPQQRNFTAVFILMPQSDVLKSIDNLKNKNIAVSYHYEGQEAVADSISLNN